MNDSNIMVSIIIPMYERKNSISGILSDIEKQTYKDYEVVLVDDGSSDGTYEYCKKNFGKFENYKIISKEHSGVSETRNKGIEKAEGRYIAFVDSDDRIEPDYLEKLVSNINGYDMVISSFDRMFYKNGCCVKTIDNYAVDADIYDMKQLSAIFTKLYLGTLIATVCCKLFKRDKILEHNICFNNDISIGEDLIFNADYMKHCERVKCIDYRGYHYICIMGESLTHMHDLQRQKYAKMLYNASLRLCDDLGLEEYAKRGVYDLHLRTCILNIEFACCDRHMSNRKGYIKKILMDEDTQMAVEMSNPTSKEFAIYKYILKTKSVVITELFARCRWVYKKMCGRA